MAKHKKSKVEVKNEAELEATLAETSELSVSVEEESSAEDSPMGFIGAALMDAASELEDFEGTSVFVEEEVPGFLPEVSEEELQLLPEADEALLEASESVEGTELDAYESAEIEDVEFVEEERLDSIIESILFASDRPVSLASLKLVFKGTNIRTDKIKKALDRFAVELAGSRRGVTLEEVTGGYQLRTKIDNLEFMKRTLKARPFKLSGPALEVLAIAAYKQPVIKSEIDEIRGVESGHLLRALMEKNLVTFEGKAETKPGKPMQYGTTKKFLEIFGLRNLRELPTLSQIDELLPEGITEDDDKDKPKLSDLTEPLSQSIGNSYSDGEEELNKVTEQLEHINTSSEFFEQEKRRQQEKRDADKAQNIRDAIMMGEEVPNRDRNWLARYDEALMAGQTTEFTAREEAVTQSEVIKEEAELTAALEAFDAEEEDSAHELEEHEIADIEGH